MKTKSDELLFSGSSDAIICVWSLKNMELVDRIQLHTNSIKGIHITKDYNIYSCGEDKTLYRIKYLDSEEYLDKKTSVQKQKQVNIEESKPMIDPSILGVNTSTVEGLDLEQALYMELSVSGEILFVSTREGFIGWDLKQDRIFFDCPNQVNGLLIIPSFENNFWLFTPENERVSVWYFSTPPNLFAKGKNI